MVGIYAPSATESKLAEFCDRWNRCMFVLADGLYVLLPAPAPTVIH